MRGTYRRALKRWKGRKAEKNWNHTASKANQSIKVHECISPKLCSGKKAFPEIVLSKHCKCNNTLEKPTEQINEETEEIGSTVVDRKSFLWGLKLMSLSIAKFFQALLAKRAYFGSSNTRLFWPRDCLAKRCISSDQLHVFFSKNLFKI